MKSSKLSVQGSLLSVGSSLSKKRSLVDRLGGDNEDDDDGGGIPRKKHSSLSVLMKLSEDEKSSVNGKPAKSKDSVTPLDIQAMLANTKKQIEERKRQTETLLAQKQTGASGGLLSARAPAPAAVSQPKPVVAAVLQHQREVLQQGKTVFQGSTHPLAYQRQLQELYGTTLGPNALDKVMKNAEVGVVLLVAVIVLVGK